MSETYELNSLSLLQSSTNVVDEPILDVVNTELKKIITAVTMSPGKSGSLNINIKVSSKQNEPNMLIIETDVKNIKIPVPDIKPTIAFAIGNGEASIYNPQQMQMFGDAKQVDQDTGEIKPVETDDSNIKPIGAKK